TVARLGNAAQALAADPQEEDGNGDVEPHDRSAPVDVAGTRPGPQPAPRLCSSLLSAGFPSDVNEPAQPARSGGRPGRMGRLGAAVTASSPRTPPPGAGTAPRPGWAAAGTP